MKIKQKIDNIFTKRKSKFLSPRRDFLKYLGLGGGVFALGSLSSGAYKGPASSEDGLSAESEMLYEEMVNYPYDDTHCHAVDFSDAQTTPQLFLQRISLAGFPIASYFPSGIYRQWREGDTQTKGALNKKYNIEAKLAEIAYHVGESVFAKYMVKEMAQFLGCSPNLNEVVEARNERGRNYRKYINDLFQDVKIENIMNDTGFGGGAGVQNEFEETIKPTKSRRIYRVETIQGELLREDISFDELESKFLAKVRKGLDEDGNYGKKSYGMKSYLMPRIGLIKPIYDAKIAQKSWEEYKSTRDEELVDRVERGHRGGELKQYLLTLALEECLQRDMPMQFHAGDGEAPGVILRQHDPYFLEEVVRFEKDGMMRMPKIIPVHAGYPLVGKAAWLSHIYTNCYFELSIMTPLIHQGLFYRYLQVMEAAPLSKILFGSDTYHVPELYWLAGRWGKRFLSQALAVYVKNKLLTKEEALEAAKMILYKNNRRVYNLPA